MEVVGRRAAHVYGRALTVLAGVAAATGVVLCPFPAAPAEQLGYRRLVELESARSFSVELTAALASGDARLAGRAALALGRTEDARAAGPLENATEAPDVSTRALAMYGYGLLAAEYPTQSEVIANRLRDSAAAVRVAAIDAAWRMKAAGRPGADALRAPLLAMLERDRDPLVRARAATALSGWRDGPGGDGVAGRVQHALSREQNLTVRWHLAWTLRRAYAKRTAAATIRAGLADPDELVRIQFADLVGRRKDPSAIPELRPLLRDPSWRVREQAGEAIRILGGGKPTEHLTAIPSGVVTPPPVPPDVEPALPVRGALGKPRRPIARDARLDLALEPSTAALMDGPMPGPHPRVRIGTTQGPIVVRLYPEWAPLAVANFLGLVERRYYDGLRWFRIVPDFVVQTGDPTNTGDGDAGYTIPAEEDPLEQRAGVISMGLNYTNGAHPKPIRDSAGTQFYITISPQLHLDRDFTVFGAIESGFPVLGRLTERDRMTRVVRLRDD